MRGNVTERVFVALEMARQEGTTRTGAVRAGRRWSARRGRFLPLVAGLAQVLTGPAWGESAPDVCQQVTAGLVSGAVQTADGNPVAGARVRVQACLGDPISTRSDGSFDLTVPAGTHVITAGAEGFGNGCWRGIAGGDCVPAAAGAAGLVIVLDQLPADDDPHAVFADPLTCKTCHPTIYEQWRRSSKAATNGNRWVAGLYNGTDATMPPGPPPDPNRPPYFAFLSRHNVDAGHPTRLGECSNCHQPEYVGAHPTNTNFNAYASASHRGVTCAFCHKIIDVDVSPAGIGRPNLVGEEGGETPAKTTMLRSGSEPAMYLGPLDDAPFSSGAMRAGYSSVMRSSALCAACHEDNADLRDANGDFRGTYDGPASQTTYSEWAASPYAARDIQCQDCHMPPTSGAEEICNAVEVRRDAQQIRSHTFEGTTPGFLRRAVTLRSSAVAEDDRLEVTAEVTNSGAGHHVPTGVTLRNLVLVVSATDRSGVRLEQLDGPVVPNWGGAGDPAAGNFAGLPGKGYARVLVDEFLAENVLFTEAVQAFDNRIPALASDATRYAFRLAKSWRKLGIQVRTTLYYRRAFKPVADQRKWNVPLGGNPHGTRGDGTDYDENFVMAEITNLLSCAGKIRKLRGLVTGEGLVVSAALKVPRGVSLDPGTHGMQVLLGDRDRPNSLIQEQLGAFVGDESGGFIFAANDTAGTVREVRVQRKGKRGATVELLLRGVDPGTLVDRRLDLGLDSGDVCFRHDVRCADKKGQVRCR